MAVTHIGHESAAISVFNSVLARSVSINTKLNPATAVSDGVTPAINDANKLQFASKTKRKM